MTKVAVEKYLGRKVLAGDRILRFDERDWFGCHITCVSDTNVFGSSTTGQR